MGRKRFKRFLKDYAIAVLLYTAFACLLLIIQLIHTFGGR